MPSRSRSCLFSHRAILLCVLISALGTVHGALGQEAHAAAQNLSIHLDPAATQIHVTVKGLVHNVRATFPLKGGALAEDPQSGLAQGQVLVDATAGRTGNTTTDRRMQSEVLESGRYPAIFFHAEHIHGSLPAQDGAADLTTDGAFNIHGADHPLSLRLHAERHGRALTLTTRFTIPYVAWGMRDPSTWLNRYSRQAEVDVTTTGTIETVWSPGATPVTSDEP